MENLKIYGEHDAATIEQMKNCLKLEESRGVLCADGHLGYAQPVGGVAAYKKHISVSGVGFDIACGNMAIKTDTRSSDLKQDMKGIMDRVFSELSFGVGRVNDRELDWDLINPEHHDLFDRIDWRGVGIEKKKALAQLGTIGAGNHYVDIFEDDEGFVWVGVHFGSRGFGHTTATKYIKLAGGKDGIMVDPVLLELGTPLADQYIAAMGWAGEYAYAGRQWVARYVVKKILGCQITDEVHNHHNFAWKEEHDGEQYWVIRKGATPAFPGQRGFVGGSMGDNAVIIRGVDSAESKSALYSTVHGAGRVMSRTAAKGKSKFNKETGVRTVIAEQRITQAEMDEWVKRVGVELRGGDVDESPLAYRRLHEVLDEHQGTIEIETTLRPIGVAMAGKWIRDEYKD